MKAVCWVVKNTNFDFWPGHSVQALTIVSYKHLEKHMTLLASVSSSEKLEYSPCGL